MHSPEPWYIWIGTEPLIFGADNLSDEGDNYPVAQIPCSTLEKRIRSYANAQRIVACVNACQGIPDINGTITLIGDMKLAIMTNDPELLEIVRKRLVELSTWPQGTGPPEHDEMEQQIREEG